MHSQCSGDRSSQGIATPLAFLRGLSPSEHPQYGPGLYGSHYLAIVERPAFLHKLIYDPATWQELELYAYHPQILDHRER